MGERYNLDEKQNEGGYRVSDSALIISQRKADQRVGTKKNLKYFKFSIFSPEPFEAFLIIPVTAVKCLLFFRKRLLFFCDHSDFSPYIGFKKGAHLLV